MTARDSAALRLALLNAQTERDVAQQEAAGAFRIEPTVHACPEGDSGILPCCGLTPFELGYRHPLDQITLDGGLVTCGGAQ